MVIEMSLALLENLKLTPNELLVVTLIKHKEFALLSDFLRKEYTQTQMSDLFAKLVKLDYLTSTSFLLNYHDYSRCKLSNKIYGLLRTEHMFDEFLEEYPKSVVRTDGVVDYLRTDQKHCQSMYLLLTKNNRATHDHIVKCLKFEVNKRTNDGSMKFMVRMSKWLSTEAWKAYEDEINDVKKANTYGTDIE
jgi:hypothetical protein